MSKAYIDGARDALAQHEAEKKWWNELTLRGDPIRRPNLAKEAFFAGWDAANEGAQRIIEAEARADDCDGKMALAETRAVLLQVEVNRLVSVLERSVRANVATQLLLGSLGRGYDFQFLNKAVEEGHAAIDAAREAMAQARGAISEDKP